MSHISVTGIRMPLHLEISQHHRDGQRKAMWVQVNQGYGKIANHCTSLSRTQTSWPAFEISVGVPPLRRGHEVGGEMSLHRRNQFAGSEVFSSA